MKKQSRYTEEERRAMDKVIQACGEVDLRRIVNYPVRRIGAYDWISCPVHSAGQEKIPSLVLYEPGTRGEGFTFFCYGCRSGGNSIRFLQFINGQSKAQGFWEAIEKLLPHTRYSQIYERNRKRDQQDITQEEN